MIITKYLPNDGYYRVKKNETLEMIANKFNTTINNVKILSNGSCNEGEFVKILKSNQFCHIVKPLEDLNSIAKEYGVTKEQIIDANGLNSNRLFIGQKLRF